jgi:hypothetical protein
VGIEFAHAIDRAIARDALRRASEGVAFYTEVYRIMALALAPELVSPSPRHARDPQRWQYVVATQIAQLLRLRTGATPSPAS